MNNIHPAAAIASQVKCPECNVEMRHEIDTCPDQHNIIAAYWVCPECGEGFSPDEPHGNGNRQDGEDTKDEPAAEVTADNG